MNSYPPCLLLFITGCAGIFRANILAGHPQREKTSIGCSKSFYLLEFSAKGESGNGF